MKFANGRSLKGDNRIYFAFAKNPRINSKGQNTSAAFGFTNSLIDILKNEKVWTRILSSLKDGQTEKQLFQVPVKSFSFPQIDKNPIEDAFDEMDGLGYPVSISPFDLLKTSFRGDVLVKDILKYVNKEVRMLGYLVSIKDVPIQKKDGKVKMNFGTWIDVEGAYFDTTHFPPTLKKYPFKGLGCYLILGKVVVDHDFPSIEIRKMERLPMVPDPRYSEENQPSFDVWDKMKVAHSKTMRAPYPSQEELDELYGRKPNSGKYDHQRDNKSSKMSLGGRR